MPQYMLLMYHPVEDDERWRRAGAGEAKPGDPTPEEMAAAQKRWQAVVQGMKDEGLLVSNAGLAGTDAATTVRVRDGETQITDGPFAETKEYLAGYFLIDAPDLDTALKHAARIPSTEYGSTEVRPVWG